MLLLVLYLLGLAGYAVFSYTVLKVAYEAGMEGDLTFPVSMAYVLVSIFFWAAAGVLLLLLRTG